MTDGKFFAKDIMYCLRSQGNNCSGSSPASEIQGNLCKKEDFTMHKSIILLGFLCALLSTVILHATVTKDNRAKTYEAVAAQFAYHVPDTEHCCTENYLF